MVQLSSRVSEAWMVLAALTCLCSTWTSAQDAPKSTDTKKEVPNAKVISALIAQLGDVSFEKREAAAKKLTETGEPALDQLEKAAKESKDAETRNIAEILFRDISKGLFTQVRAFDGHKGPKQPWVTRLVITPDGHRAVTVGGDSLRCWDLATGMQILAFDERKGTLCWGLGISADGSRVIAGCAGGSAHVFDLATGKKVQSFVHKAGVWGVALSADGKEAISGGRDRTICVWDVATGREIRAFEGVTDEVRCLDRSRDGKLVVTGHYRAEGEPGDVRIWDYQTGKALHTMQGHKEAVTSVAFSPDSQTVLSSSWDRTVRLWDVASGKERKVLEGHVNRVEHAAFAFNGKRVVGCGNLGSPTLRIWDAETGKQVYESEAVPEGFFGVGALADGRQCVSGGRDGVARLWQWKR